MVSVDYSDYLDVTLPHNRHFFDSITVGTLPKDRDTIRLCDINETEYFLSDTPEKARGEFNKAGIVCRGLEILYKRYPDDWYCLLDSDILVYPGFRELPALSELNDKLLYGCRRCIIEDAVKIFLPINYPELIKIGVWDSPISIRYGFFQLFKKHFYPVIKTGTSLYDDSLRRLFGGARELSGMHCIHIGKTGINWKGRKR